MEKLSPETCNWRREWNTETNESIRLVTEIVNITVEMIEREN